MRKNALLIAIEIVVLILAGCGYQLINPEQKTVYVELFSNYTLQPKMEQFLLKNIRKTLAEAPGFMLVSKKSDANIVINGKISKFSRNPEFIDGSDQIVMASYTVGILLEIGKDGETLRQKLEQTYFMELQSHFRLDQILDAVSKKVALDIYFRLIQLYEK
ncbi:MAG: hypothetical protein NC830_02775 [Candidatus Omnitrophica bacterium]|nr:hypothetical protein [Candidatus Omnitrophota bacterium]